MFEPTHGARSRLGATAIVLLAASGCASVPASPPTAVLGAPALHPDVAALDWLTGRWSSTDGAQEEHWTPAGDVLVGVRFAVRDGKTSAWEVLLVRKDSEALVLAAMPSGQVETVLHLAGLDERSATFTSTTPGAPRTVRYARTDAEGRPNLAVTAGGDGGAVRVEYRRAEPAPAAVLEALDRAFADDSARRGGDAWADAFATDGAMGRPSRRIEGRAAVRAVMTPYFTAGYQLEWAPTASGLSPAGDLGFTVGRSRVLAKGPAGLAEAERGAYVTIWRLDPDGRWRVLYDTGDQEGSS